MRCKKYIVLQKSEPELLTWEDRKSGNEVLWTWEVK